MEPGPFGLTSDEFWTAPDRTLDTVASKCLAQGREYLIVDAPTIVDIDKRESFPMLSYYTSSHAQARDLPYEGNALVCLMDSDSNALRTTTVPAMDGLIMPDREPPEGFSGCPCRMDLRSALSMDWRPGEYLLTVIMRDQVSNRRRVSLRGSGSADPDVDTDWPRALKRRKRPPRKVSPAVRNDIVVFSKQGQSPGLPEGCGIVLRAEPSMHANEDATPGVHASLRVAIPPHDVVRITEGDRPSEVGDPKARAVIGATIIAVGSKTGGAYVLPMTIPSYDEIQGTAEAPIATGYFTLDLLKIEGMGNPAETYFLYVFAGSEMTGPVLSAIVDKEAEG